MHRCRWYKIVMPWLSTCAGDNPLAKACRKTMDNYYMGGFRGGHRGSGPPMKNHKNIGFLSNTGPDPLKITKLPASIHVGPSSACKRNAILMAFCWRAYDGPFIVIFGSSIP